MCSKKKRDISMNLTSFFMKVVGFWVADNSVEECHRTLARVYTMCAMLIAIVFEIREFYFTWGDFSTSIYITCNILSVTIGMFKMLISFIHKMDVVYCVLYAKKNFWHSNYDPNEQAILNRCRRTCTLLICFFNFFAQGTIASYIVKPIIANIGKNESDRVLPVNMWLNLPLSITPYFEMAFTMQVFIMYIVDVCYLCFDNFLCLLSMHTACQFRILQYRLINLYDLIESRKNNENTGKGKCHTAEYYETFRNYMLQHQALIQYCRRLEKLFTLIVLGQVLLFSLLICLDGYLIMMEGASQSQRLTFTFHVVGCIIQLLMFTYSCDSLIRESSNVAQAAYASLWTFLPMDKGGQMARKDLILVIQRSQMPCCLTAGGFFVISLETFTKVLSSAVSYFTLLTHC